MMTNKLAANDCNSGDKMLPPSNRHSPANTIFKYKNTIHTTGGDQKYLLKIAFPAPHQNQKKKKKTSPTARK